MANKYEVVVSAKLDSSSLNSLKKQIEDVGNDTKIKIKTDSSQVDSLTESVKNLGESAKNTSQHTQSLVDIAGKFVQWQVVGDVVNGVKNAMEDMVQQVFDLDESLVELDKVTDLTSSGLQDLEDQAFAVGEQIGATGKDIIDATTIFAQAGYEAQEALDLGEQAIILENVSEAGATAAESAQTLISTLKGFKDDGLDAAHVVDSLNEVNIRASRYSNVA